jgi:hypothetical protein
MFLVFFRVFCKAIAQVLHLSLCKDDNCCISTMASTCWGIMFFSISSALLRFKLFFRVFSRANPASVAGSSEVWESRDILKELSLAILFHTFYCDMVFSFSFGKRKACGPKPGETSNPTHQERGAIVFLIRSHKL